CRESGLRQVPRIRRDPPIHGRELARRCCKERWLPWRGLADLPGEVEVTLHHLRTNPPRGQVLRGSSLESKDRAEQRHLLCTYGNRIVGAGTSPNLAIARIRFRSGSGRKHPDLFPI